MEVLKQTSPTEAPVAPSPRPQSTVPSARTRTAVAPSGRDAAAALSTAPAGVFSDIGDRPHIDGHIGRITLSGSGSYRSRPIGPQTGTRQDRGRPAAGQSGEARIFLIQDDNLTAEVPLRRSILQSTLRQK